jgi:hypothetical protein
VQPALPAVPNKKTPRNTAGAQIFIKKSLDRKRRTQLHNGIQFDDDRDSGKKLQLTRNARKRSPISFVASAYRTGAVMSDVTNLNRFRKRVERDKQAKKADANRARFGRTKAEREADERREQRLREVHEQHRIKSGDEA